MVLVLSTKFEVEKYTLACLFNATLVIVQKMKLTNYFQPDYSRCHLNLEQNMKLKFRFGLIIPDDTCIYSKDEVVKFSQA